MLSEVSKRLPETALLLLTGHLPREASFRCANYLEKKGREGREREAGRGEAATSRDPPINR